LLFLLGFSFYLVPQKTLGILQKINPVFGHGNLGIVKVNRRLDLIDD
jgi:hypothetical protein